MYELQQGHYNWNQIVETVLSLPKHTDVIVEKWMVPNIPEEFTERMADNDDQLADYGLALEDDSGIHIKVYDEYYKVHWDEKDPSIDPIGHLVKDAPHWIIIGLFVAISIFAIVRSR